MKTAVVFYSFHGVTKKFAQNEANIRKADLFEIKEAKKRNIFTAFVPGCIQSGKQQDVPLEFAPDLSEYDHFVLMSPVWAGFPAPAFNSALNILPDGAEVEVFLVSGGGDTSKNAATIKALVAERGLTLSGYTDLKSASE